MRPRLIIWCLLLLMGCSQEIPRNLEGRYRIPKHSYEQLSQENWVWLGQQLVGVDSVILYDFFRFSANGRVFHSTGIPEDSLAFRYNDFSKGSLGRFELTDQSLRMEIWRGRYDKFVHYQGHFQGDSLIITSSRQRGFFKARQKNFQLIYSKSEISDLQPIPE
ncbi:MAG: hypothetical protein OER04_07885 [Cyclobacteriaceae bacterium]|nr:hypothetical protein [Cyclobacteriaceae bacterium]